MSNNMTLLQLKVDQSLKKAIKKTADEYGVTSSAIVKMVLFKAFLNKNMPFDVGNIFNADRDNQGKGIVLDDFISLLKKYDGQAGKISAKTGAKKKKTIAGKNK